MGWPEAVANRDQDRFGDTFGIRDDVRIPEAKDRPAKVLEEFGAFGVMGRLDVLAAVELNCQSNAATGEIEDVAAYYQLPGESRAVGPQAKPDQAFCLGGVGSQVAGALCHQGRDARHFRETGVAKCGWQPTPNPSLPWRGVEPLRAYLPYLKGRGRGWVGPRRGSSRPKAPSPPPNRSPTPIGSYTRPTIRLRRPPHRSRTAPAPCVTPSSATTARRWKCRPQ